MPKVTETLRYRKCPRCGNKVYYEKTPEGWQPLGDAEFDVGDWYVNLICDNCGWRIDTNIRPKNVW